MSRYQVAKHSADGLITCRLLDRESGMEAEISPGMGNNLFRLSVNGLDILASPAEISGLAAASYRYGTPILFPPNRVKLGRFFIRG